MFKRKELHRGPPLPVARRGARAASRWRRCDSAGGGRSSGVVSAGRLGGDAAALPLATGRRGGRTAGGARSARIWAHLGPIWAGASLWLLARRRSPGSSGGVVAGVGDGGTHPASSSVAASNWTGQFGPDLVSLLRLVDYRQFGRWRLFPPAWLCCCYLRPCARLICF
jgi:hypothetical protein